MQKIAEIVVVFFFLNRQILLAESVRLICLYTVAPLPFETSRRFCTVYTSIFTSTSAYANSESDGMYPITCSNGM